jgi:hypothetical protein
MPTPEPHPAPAVASLATGFGEPETRLLFSNRPLSVGELATFKEIKAEYLKLALKCLEFPDCDSRKVAIRLLKQSQDAISIALIIGI